MSSRRIMIVEDDKDIMENLKTVFEDEGYDILTAENGQEALNVLRDTEELPKLIFLDLMMPVMDGQQFILAKGEIERIKDIPVVVLTAAVKKIEGKYNRIMSKPVDLFEVLDVAEKLSK